MAELTIKSGAKYQQYEEYKESGVKWLSQLPVGWDVERTKRMLCLRRELVGANSLDYQLLSLTLRGVVPRDISNGDGKIPADFSTYQEVEEKDLIFCLFDIDETPRTVGLSPEKGMITGAYNVYQTSDRCSSRYAYYYFLHIDLRKGLRPFYTGLRKVVRSETFGNIKMPCPSYEEQTKIANFLDHETAQIDTLIKKQQTLIQLLKEKRQAVISHAVTKGLNPDAPMKDSGVEWLGEVPEHWEVTKAKYISDIFIPQRNKPELNAIEGCPWVTMEDMKSQYIDEVHRYVKIEAMQESGSKVLKAGAVIASCVGNFGVTSINRVDVIINQQLQAFQPKRIKPEYLQAIVELSKSYFELIGTAATLIYVNREGFENLPVIVPTTQEQEAISEFINIKSKQFDLLVSKAEQAIQLMQERRTALISAAVTGKVDVRGWRVPDVEL